VLITPSKIRVPFRPSLRSDVTQNAGSATRLRRWF
jgi:hypothetical protein